MSFSIAGKTAIVTGAANGVGLAIARHFTARGANVVYADIDEEALVAEVGEASQAEGANVRYFVCDVRKKLALSNLVSGTIDAFDRIDILVNAARVVTRGQALDPDDDAVQSMLDENLMPALRLSQMVAKRMIAQAERDGQPDAPVGAMVNLSSISAQRSFKGMMGYSIASAAIDQMTRGLAVALAGERIRVNGVAFGSVMSAGLIEALKEFSDLRPAIIAATPLGRIAAPSELAEVVQFLASDAAGFITGQILTIDGGRSLLDTVRIAHG